MAEKSIFWTTGATGDGASEYTQAELIRWMRQHWLSDNTDEGVLKNYANELEVTGTSSPVAVNTGAAVVYGFPYWSTASVDVAVPTPSANTRIDRIVLEADWTAQTVRITRVAGTEGTGSPPSLTQTDGVEWQVSLAQASITTGGVITVTDERVFCHPNIEVETAMIAADAITGAKIADDQIDSEHYVDGSIDTAHIDDGQVTTAKIADDAVDDTKVGNRVPQLYRRQGGSATIWSTAGNTTYTPTTVRMQCGTKAYDGTGSDTVTFPTAFSYAPIVILTPMFDSTAVFAFLTAVTASSFDFQVVSYAGSQTAGNCYWLAIGPE